MNIEFCENCDTLLTLSEIDETLKNICKQCGNVVDNKNYILYTQTYLLKSTKYLTDV